MNWAFRVFNFNLWTEFTSSFSPEIQEITFETERKDFFAMGVEGPHPRASSETKSECEKSFRLFRVFFKIALSLLTWFFKAPIDIH